MNELLKDVSLQSIVSITVTWNLESLQMFYVANVMNYDLNWVISENIPY